MLLTRLFRKKSLDVILKQGGDGEHSGLNKVLTVKDLTFFGIAAIIGGGTFSAIGNACFSGGPGVILLYIICAIACGFTAMCYAEFASRVPVSGSAYTYAYVSFGELFAWIIGWALLMEYSIGNIYIAFSWSGYFTNLLESFGLHLPEWLTINYKSAHVAFLENKTGEGYLAWQNAPEIAGLKIIFDMPAVLINVLITYLIYRGTSESKNVSNFMVYLKLVVIVLVIAVGAFYIDIDNWTPFMPNGFKGVMAGVSAVFFAYIGFDAVSTLAEESKNPQHDLPRGMIYSLVVCTIVYIILALVLTGMVKYDLLGVSDPLAEIFALKGIKWMLFIVSIAAVAAMTSVMLVFQMGQPRIWMTMSRDGLMPKQFASIHPKYKTPGFATIVTGIVVGLPIFFTDENFVLDFTSIGTLFAFVLVCGGVLMLAPHNEKEANNPTKGKFRIPYINSKWIFPIIVVLSLGTINFLLPDYFSTTFSLNETNLTTNLPFIVFFIFTLVMAVLSFLKNLSLIPLLGLISCCYLLTGMAVSNWKWFGVWLLIGLVIYFSYGFKNSKLNKNSL
ncbi:amino acid permease [Flavobacterium columnare]|uniref:Amino acid permease n=1 Tax=Flavobacterium columnare (strain ATCC 49512 / CIP 103533 / TG 44/87) TaxID=1041826 RepID=G8X7C8_FLACA|nr:MULTISPECIES: amino acid permease [Flavobacterium]AEW84942.1 amino acid permease [Flavobacterium columnare ATCC 49512]ANO48215.1 amino acid permease [Flavobacterium columnare]QOG88582.1 amino acid permease [Flavobacterium columnare]QOG91242.1 amino acid permease [Flavobacterium columnare]QOG93904.1 amino acid permease [Flavobacterium columnare]